MLGGEVVEGQQFRAVFDQLGDGPLVLHAIGFHEKIEGRVGLLPVFDKHRTQPILSHQEIVRECDPEVLSKNNPK